MTKRILLIDNFDSFVYKLGDEFARLGCDVAAYRANLSIEKALSVIDTFQPEGLVLSPGPGTPAEATLSMQLLQHVPDTLPILGVCLGHQCIIEYFGGKVIRCSEVMHGKTSKITHNNQGLFQGLPNPLQIGRYHSLVGVDLPNTLTVDAQVDEFVMAVRHNTRPIYGVQFHPESVLTPNGLQLIEHFKAVL